MRLTPGSAPRHGCTLTKNRCILSSWKGKRLEQQLEPDSAHGDNDEAMSRQRRVLCQKGSLT